MSIVHQLGDAIEGWDFARECKREFRHEGTTVQTKEAGGSPTVPCGLSSLPVPLNSLTESLETCGFAAFDNASGAPYASALREEILGLFRAGLLQPSFNKLATARDESGVVSSGHKLQKSGVWELDVCGICLLLILIDFCDTNNIECSFLRVVCC